MNKVMMFFLLLFLVSTGVSAADIQWELVGSVKQYPEFNNRGYLYKSTTNDIMHHKGEDKINALYINLPEQKRKKKNNGSRYCQIVFYIALSPYYDDYSGNKGDSKHPFGNLAFGFHKKKLRPNTYGGMDLLVTGALYRHSWAVRSGVGVEHIFAIQEDSNYHFLHDYISFRGNSIRYAPVQICVLIDSIDKKISFYLNGVFQSEVPAAGRNLQYSPGTFLLFWTREKSNRERRMFELSAVSVDYPEQKPQMEPFVLKTERYSGFSADKAYKKAWDALYGEKINWKTGFQEMKKLADMEHAQAAFETACCYARGIGCKQDFALAAKYAELAAENDIPDAARLYLQLFQADRLPKSLLSDLKKKEFLRNEDLPMSLKDPAGLVTIGNNPKVYAKSLALTIPHTSGNEKSALLAELKKLADQGFPYAMYLYSKNCMNESEREEYLKKAAAENDPDAIHDQLTKKLVKLEDLDLHARLAYTGKYLVEYAGINRSLPYDTMILNLQISKQKTEASFVLAELKMLPGMETSASASFEAAQLMIGAAKTDPLAQFVFLRRYLEGKYGTQQQAVQIMKLLLKSHKDDPLVQELKLLLLEKWSPGKWKKDWLKLAKDGSVAAYYQLGGYAERSGNAGEAAMYQKEFLKRSNEELNRSAAGIYYGGAGQYFAGFLPIPEQSAADGEAPDVF